MGEKAERDYRAKACKQGRANIRAHSGTCQPPARERAASSRPNSGERVRMHDTCVRVPVCICTL